jgi:glyoxylase-like metal-dependent hydrolase (beta-lactamase superfamily II)
MGAIIAIVQTAIENTGAQGVLRLRVDSNIVYFLFRGSEAVLIGAGQSEHLPLIERALKSKNMMFENIRAILLPNANSSTFAALPMLREKCKALVYINRLEEPRLAMRQTGTRRWNLRRVMESHLQKKLGCKPSKPDLFIADGDVLDLWYGLTVVGLAGYSAGNCGFYCRHLNLLFTGHLPVSPKLFTRIGEKLLFDTEILAKSRAKIIEMKPAAILAS